MKHRTPDTYARALLLLAKDAQGQTEIRIIRAFLMLLRKNRDWRKRHEVVRALEALVRSNESRRLLLIETARPLTQSQRARIIEQFPPVAYDYEERIVPKLVAGARLTIDRRASADGSLTHILARLFA